MVTRVTTGTLARFLFGDREAICTLASAPAAIGLGLLFVLSAGLAREYDGKDLLAEPRHLFLPLVASLGTSFVLFCLIAFIASLRGFEGKSFVGTYLRFLGVYWMTAPLAWLYAIPVERFMTPLGATQANLALLGVVSIWRVGLMIRVINVLFGASLVAASFVVLLFADVVLLVTVVMTHNPIWDLMGGIRATPSEEAVGAMLGFFGMGSVLTFPVWLIGCLVAAVSRKRPWSLAVEDEPRRGVGVGAWGLGLLSVAVWGLVLPVTQRPQQLAHAIDVEFEQGHVQAALAELSRHEPSELPPHWEPPPREGDVETTVHVLEIAVKSPVPEWVRTSCVRKLDRWLGSWRFRPQFMEPQKFDRAISLLLALPEGPQIVASHPAWFREAAERAKECAPECRERFDQLLARIDSDGEGI